MSPLERIQCKCLSLEKTIPTINQWKEEGHSIVFTNGCFDLLHYGHIHYLAEAAALGDKLIVGLNSDASVGRLKGKHRPIKDERNRQFILAALEFVHRVILFHEDTPLKLIQKISPTVLVKGGDWTIESIVGADWVLQKGGKVKSLAFVEGYSTTLLEQKIRNAQNKRE